MPDVQAKLSERAISAGQSAPDRIDPYSLAFDIDDVVADTMSLFLDIARDEYDIKGVTYEDITSYSLEECLDIEKPVIDSIITSLVDGDYTKALKPIDGSIDVLTKLCELGIPVLFVTARPHVGPMQAWMSEILRQKPSSFEIIATGSFDGKTEALLSRNIRFFVEDRLETCFLLNDKGISPILFKQPWNRSEHPFMEVTGWNQLESMIHFY